MTELTGKQKRFLRARAHELDPVVQIGNAGLTEGVVNQMDRALEHHELIKVKLAREAPLTKEEATSKLPQETGSHLVGQVGRVVILYRARKKDPTIELPRPDKR